MITQKQEIKVNGNPEAGNKIRTSSLGLTTKISADLPLCVWAQ